MTKKIPSNWKNCATCSNWCGCVKSDFFRQWVEYDPNERAACVGGFRGATMQPLATCGQWEQRFR